MKKFLTGTLKVLSILLVIILVSFYLGQEKLIFHPHQLAKDYQYEFSLNFEEINIKMEDDQILNGVLFPCENSKGLVFYLHGNAGSINNCENVVQTFTNLNYDLFVLDYRGFGKSEGSIRSQNQIYSDVQTAYTFLLERYQEEEIIVLGYSIGTGIATHLAANNQPKLLLLQAPYFNLSDMMTRYYPYLPTFLLKYKFPINDLITSCKMPVVVFHGTDDRVIPYESSIMLQDLMKENDQLITLEGVGHGNINSNPNFKSSIEQLLN